MTSIVFVHNLHRGSVSDWQDDNGVYWPAEHLSLDLGNARIFAFGYEPTKVSIGSDGHFGGGLVLKQGMDLLKALNAKRTSVEVPFPSQPS